MSRIEFMNELNALLQGVSVEEREAAMQYYNDYFDDAGPENEAEIIKELGSPQKVAATIRAGLGGENEFNSEYSETGYTDTRFEKYETPAKREGYRSTAQDGDIRDKKPWTSKTLKVVLVILIVLIGVPTVVPAVGGIFVGIIGILIAAAVIIAVILFLGIGVAIGGVVLFAAGMAQIFHSLPVALGLAGAGLLTIAAGAIMAAFTWWICLKIVPPVFRWFVELCRKPFQARRESRQ